MPAPMAILGSSSARTRNLSRSPFSEFVDNKDRIPGLDSMTEMVNGPMVWSVRNSDAR